MHRDFYRCLTCATEYSTHLNNTSRCLSLLPLLYTARTWIGVAREHAHGRSKAERVKLAGGSQAVCQ